MAQLSLTMLVAHIPDEVLNTYSVEPKLYFRRPQSHGSRSASAGSLRLHFQVPLRVPDGPQPREPQIEKLDQETLGTTRIPRFFSSLRTTSAPIHLEGADQRGGIRALQEAGDGCSFEWIQGLWISGLFVSRFATSHMIACLSILTSQRSLASCKQLARSRWTPRCRDKDPL